MARGIHQRSRDASISPDGLITAKAGGVATITVINGGLQATLTLTVQPAVVGPTVATVADGAVTQDTNGNTLMIGAGALGALTPVSISTLDLNNLDMPPPAPAMLNALGAVTINLSGATTSLPVQLALKVNSPTPLAAGTQVMFWQEGTITDANGVSHKTWWLMDNGVIGSDGLAHTSSPPYVGITTSGNILVTGTAHVDPLTGAEKIQTATIDFNAIWAQQELVAITPTPLMAIAALDLIGAMSDVSGVTYTVAGSYQLQLPKGALLPNSTGLDSYAAESSRKHPGRHRRAVQRQDPAIDPHRAELHFAGTVTEQLQIASLAGADRRSVGHAQRGRHCAGQRPGMGAV